MRTREEVATVLELVRETTPAVDKRGWAVTAGPYR